MPETFLSCPECLSTFAENKNLLKHVRKFHPFSDLEVKIKNRRKCHACDKKFEDISELKEHVDTVHSGASLNTCARCQHVFTAKKNLYQHMKTFHPLDEINYLEKHLICCLCDAAFLHMKDLHIHIQIKHTDITLSFHDRNFHSLKEFYAWKINFEKVTHAHFSKHSGDKLLADGRTAMKYFCHRSGSYGPKKEKTGIKSTSTKKIGKTCPAFILAYKKKGSRCY